MDGMRRHGEVVTAGLRAGPDIQRAFAQAQDAARAWLRLAQEFRQDGFLQFAIPDTRYYILQLAEGHLTQRLFGQILGHIERLVWHPT